MRMALALLCIGAVTFLLRVLVALVREAMNGPGDMRVYLAKFSPSRRGAELILMHPESQRHNSAARTGERIALVVAAVGLLAVELMSGEPLCKMLFG